MYTRNAKLLHLPMVLITEPSIPTLVAVVAAETVSSKVL